MSSFASSNAFKKDARFAVSVWYGAGLATALAVAGSNPTRDCCAPTPTQRAIPPGSVNEYQRKAGE